MHLKMLHLFLIIGIEELFLFLWFSILWMTTYLGFKAAVHADNEWIFGEAEDVPLREDLLCLIA